MSLVPCKHGSYDLDACLACAREETEALRSTLNDVRRERLALTREIEDTLDLLTPALRSNGLRDAAAQRMTELTVLRANVASLEHENEELRAMLKRTSGSSDEPSVTWSCYECGSQDVEETAWRKVNTHEVTSFGENGPRDVFWCNKCDAERDLVIDDPPKNTEKTNG